VWKLEKTKSQNSKEAIEEVVLRSMNKNNEILSGEI